MSDIKFTGTSDFTKIKKDYDDLARRTAKVEAENARLGRTGQEQAKAYKGARREMSGMLAVGSGVFSGLTMAATGYLAVMREINEANERASASVSGAARGMGPLGQLRATPADLKRLRSQAESLYLMGATSQTGAGGIQEAGNLAFSLESAGMLGDLNMFGQLGASQLVKPEELASLAIAMKTMRSSMGTDEVGSNRQLLSKAFEASGYNPASVPALLQATSRTGVNARALGFSDEAMLTATAMLATSTGTPERGATQLDALLRSMRAKGGFEGPSFGHAVSKIQKMGLSDPELVKYLGSSEAMSAYGVLTNQQGEYRTNLRGVMKAQQTDVVAQRIRNNLMGLDVRTDLKERQVTARSDIQELHAGRMEKLADAVRTEKTRIRREKSGDLAGGVMSLGGKLSDAFTTNEWFLRNVNMEGSFDPVLRQQVRDALAQQNALTASQTGGWGWSFQGNTAQNVSDAELANNMTRQMEQTNRIAAQSSSNAARADVAIPIE